MARSGSCVRWVIRCLIRETVKPCTANAAAQWCWLVRFVTPMSLTASSREIPAIIATQA